MSRHESRGVQLVTHAPVTWADGFGVWHVAVDMGPREVQRARREILAELVARGEVTPEARAVLGVQLVTRRNIDGRATYREAWPDQDDDALPEYA